MAAALAMVYRLYRFPFSFLNRLRGTHCGLSGSLAKASPRCWLIDLDTPDGDGPETVSIIRSFDSEARLIMRRPSVEGTSQGGPLSPLLSNLVLDELDRELECRGRRFVRYADDCNIYVRSERAGQRVMTSITRFITQKLKLKVNETKSAVARPQERRFLGFSFTGGPEVKRAIAPKALERLVPGISREPKAWSMNEGRPSGFEVGIGKPHTQG